MAALHPICSKVPFVGATFAQNISTFAGYEHRSPISKLPGRAKLEDQKMLFIIDEQGCEMFQIGRIYLLRQIGIV